MYISILRPVPFSVEVVVDPPVVNNNMKTCYKVDVWYLDMFPSTPTSCRIWNTQISLRWSANPNHGCSHLSYNSSKLIWISSSSSKWRFACSLSGYNPPPSPSIMVIIEPRMVRVFWTHSSISFKHIYFWVFVVRSTPNHVTLKYKSSLLQCWI